MPKQNYADRPQPLKGNITKVFHGYAWLKGDDGRDYFMHRSAIQLTSPRQFSDLKQDDRIEFLPVEAGKGPRAIEVRVL